VVTFKNLSAYDGEPPTPDGNRKIPGGPLYVLAEIQAISAQAGAVVLWTRNCIKDAADLGLDTDDVGGLLQELVAGSYRGSEWCENGKAGWVAADAYTLKRQEFIEAAGKWMSIEYYLKFAKGKTGKLVLMVSCHPPRQR
jgi:hypothetical protein